MQTERGTFRFAPSPNGYLHLGHAFSAFLNADAAYRTGGRFLLRIEDIDQGRARTEYVAAIFQDLAWLGLEWEVPVLRQSERFDSYRKMIRKLTRLGLLYPAFMTRSEIRAAVLQAGEDWPRDPDNAPLYPGPERDWPMARRKAEMARGRPFALRIDMARTLEGLPQLAWSEVDPFTGAAHQVAADPGAWGDVVIARSDCPASYHLAVTVDDAHQAVSHVIRGVDLAPSTAVHRALQYLLGLPVPDYFHHRLVADEHGEKLSKRVGSTSLRDLRAGGLSPDEIRRTLHDLLTEPALRQFAPGG
ncbi:MAG TPA: tRNA glutamyl-Q(34) synthetase GluQRS [Afifellaceae bacterium]|nr:tRNA glutamyl-Q(34) synthetase GluQRS [Afifellaceae bacterium]